MQKPLTYRYVISIVQIVKQMMTDCNVVYIRSFHQTHFTYASCAHMARARHSYTVSPITSACLI